MEFALHHFVDGNIGWNKDFSLAVVWRSSIRDVHMESIPDLLKAGHVSPHTPLEEIENE